MFSLTQTLCIGALLLVITASIPAPRKPGVAWAWVVGLAMLGLGSFATHTFVQTSGYAPDSRPSARAKYAKQRLPKLKAKNVLWLDGGSYPTKGVLPDVLKRELSKLGYEVDVMHLAMAAANHFERETLYRRLASQFDSKRNRRKKQRWVYLAEVHSTYDKKPLAQFTKNSETARTYDYLTPIVVWDALRAIASANVKKPEHPWRQRLEILRHGLVFAFNAGITSRVISPRKIKALSGADPSSRAKRFRYPGMSKVIASAKRPRPARVPQWLFDIREHRELEIWGKHITKWIYYALPSTKVSYMEHSISFCKATKRPCISPSDVELLKRLDARKNWHDEGHMSTHGGQIYSKWLAQQLHHSGVLAH